MVERPSAKIPDEQSDGNAEGGSSVRIPAYPPQEPECVHAPEEEKDSLSLLKAKADDLLRKLVTA